MRAGRTLLIWVCAAGCAQASTEAGPGGLAAGVGGPATEGEGEGEGEAEGKTDEPDRCLDVDGDGFGEGCEAGPDCDDGDPDVRPGADDLCGDGVDQDCSGEADDPEGGCAQCEPAERRPCALGGCVGEATCRADGQWAACEVSPQPELCDGVDNDCDALVDEDAASGPECGCGAAQCQQGAWRCPLDEDRLGCVCGEPLCLPGGWACVGDGDLGEACETGEAGVCRSGAFVCRQGAVVCGPNVEPGQEAERCNGADDDCDGTVDEAAPGVGDTCDTGGTGQCGLGERRCLGGRLVCAPLYEAVDEVCEDGLDDDCDGEVDEAPPCPACVRDVAEVVERGCVHNDSPQCAGHTADWMQDCDLGLGKTEVAGGISHEGDEDWYFMVGQDGLCEMAFEATLEGIPPDADYDLCAWWSNDDGTPADIDCEGAADVRDDLGDIDLNRFDGAPGCCSRQLGDAPEALRIVGDFTRGQALIRVWSTRGLSCEPYRLRYWF